MTKGVGVLNANLGITNSPAVALRDSAAIYKTLSSVSPLAHGMPIFYEFFQWFEAGAKTSTGNPNSEDPTVFVPPTKIVNGKVRIDLSTVLFYHMTECGKFKLNALVPYIKCKNTWGPDLGDAGYFKIAVLTPDITSGVYWPSSYAWTAEARRPPLAATAPTDTIPVVVDTPPDCPDLILNGQQQAVANTYVGCPGYDQTQKQITENSEAAISSASLLVTAVATVATVMCID